MLWSKAIGAGGSGGVVEGWNVSTAVFLQSFSVADREARPAGITFKPDGLKMYVIGVSTGSVNEYTLSIAWDVSTAVFLRSKNILAQDGAPRKVFFKPDGLKMYVAGGADSAVDEYTLSTAWNVSTAVFVQNFSVAAQATPFYGLTFKPDGLKMYVTGSSGVDVNEYTLSTAWSVSTAVFVQNFSVAAQESVPTGVFFKPDGLKMYVIGLINDRVNEYTLSTAWSVSTAVFVQNFSVAAQEPSPFDVFFKPDGLKMYVIGEASDSVHEYDLTA